MNRKHFVYLLVIYATLMVIVHLLRGARFPIDNIIGMDKFLHFTEYVIFAFLFINAIKAPNLAKIFLIVIIGTTFGALIEFLQCYVAGRYASVYDAIANTVGLITGSFLSYKYLIISDDKKSVH